MERLESTQRQSAPQERMGSPSSSMRLVIPDICSGPANDHQPWTVAQEAWCGHQPGEVSSPSTPFISLGVPAVSRLCPVQGRLSKARVEKGFPAQSKATERLFGRGRQRANQRITGGLVSHDQRKRLAAAQVDAVNVAAGSSNPHLLDLLPWAPRSEQRTVGPVPTGLFIVVGPAACGSLVGVRRASRQSEDLPPMQERKPPDCGHARPGPISSGRSCAHLHITHRSSVTRCAFSVLPLRSTGVSQSFGWFPAAPAGVAATGTTTTGTARS